MSLHYLPLFNALSALVALLLFQLREARRMANRAERKI